MNACILTESDYNVSQSLTSVFVKTEKGVCLFAGVFLNRESCRWSVIIQSDILPGLQ